MKCLNILYCYILISLFKVDFFYSQHVNEDSEKIINVILNDIVDGALGDLLYLNSDKPKTSFEKSNFIDETGINNISENILNELEKKSDQFILDDAKWPNCLFKKIKKEYPNIKIKKCTKDKYERSVKDGALIYTFHNPLFDNKKKYCVITIVRSFNKFGFEAQDFFLEKKKGEWKIVTRYNYIIS